MVVPSSTRAVHLWNEMWRRAGRDKDSSYHPACLFEQLEGAVRHPATVTFMIVLRIRPLLSPSGAVVAVPSELHDRKHRVLCDTVGLEHDQVLELKQAYPKVVCRNSEVSGAVTPAVMANRKPFVLRSAIECFVDEPWFCLLDADMLVRGPLDDLWGLVEDAPVVPTSTDGMWEALLTRGS